MQVAKHSSKLELSFLNPFTLQLEERQPGRHQPLPTKFKPEVAACVVAAASVVENVGASVGTDVTGASVGVAVVGAKVGIAVVGAKVGASVGAAVLGETLGAFVVACVVVEDVVVVVEEVTAWQDLVM